MLFITLLSSMGNMNSHVTRAVSFQEKRRAAAAMRTPITVPGFCVNGRVRPDANVVRR